MRPSLLEQIGLTKSEVKVYLALLELGSSSTGRIVDKAKVSSSKIYEILDKLMQKGLVSYIIKAGVKYFEAAPAERIMDYMKEKEENIAKQKQEIKKMIPELELKQRLSKYKSEATIFKGMKGMETAFYGALKLLKKRDEMLAYGIPSRSKKVNRFFVRLAKARAERKNKMRIIFNEEARGELQTLSENNPMAEIKFMPESVPASINIFGDRIIIFPAEIKEPLLFVIDNKEVAEAFRMQLEKLWRQETVVVKGFDEFEKMIYRIMDELSSRDSYDVLGAGFGPKKHEKTYMKFFAKIHRERIKRGLKSRLLFQQGVFETNKEIKIKAIGKNIETRSLPYKTKSPVATFPGKEKTLLVIQEKEPTTIIIYNKEITNSFRRQFETLWRQSKKQKL